MTVSTHIMVEGELMDASLQPAHSHLQAAFRKTAKGGITIHMPTAKNVARDMIRAARVPKFAVVDSMRGLAIDNEDPVKRIEVKGLAKKLRDAPSDPRIEAATTPEELDAAVAAIIAEF